jgi:rod shape determining protein RodA
MVRRGPLPAFGPSKGFDWVLITAALFLLTIGLLAIYSVDSARLGGVYFPKQVFFAAIGFALMAATAIIPPDFWKRIWAWVYGASVLLLLITVVGGKERLGAQRWVEFGPIELQPSELAKVGMAICIAGFFASRKDENRGGGPFWGSLLLVVPVLTLLMMQPHLGATISIAAMWLAITVAAGVPLRYPLGAFLDLIAILVGAFFSPKLPGELEYMRGRITAKLNPDTQGNAYQQDQAMIAIGTGGIWGKGFRKGDRTKQGYVPLQHNDFIFTVVAEEGGLAASFLVILGFSFFFLRAWWIAVCAQSDFGRMTAIGLGAVLGFHAIVNLGMNLGITPVVGLWLPFMSYGGTALWMCFLSVGLLLSIHRHESA